jgi:hypothetical protein
MILHFLSSLCLSAVFYIDFGSEYIKIGLAISGEGSMLR